MSQPQYSSVHRYFPLADSFVEVLQLSPEAQVVEAPHGLDRAAYRRFVIGTCMPQFARELANDFAELFPEDSADAENSLYELCVEVNPVLEIHAVKLRTPGPRSSARTQEQPSPKVTELDPLERLGRISQDLERRLAARVHGQAAAINRLCRAVEKAAAGLSAANRPLGSFLLVGRTGTGKTELTRQLAEILGSPRRSAGENLIRVDCSEFALAHDYSKLIGSPPGYIGHEEGGQLTRALLANPEAVVLFDEVEKAHPRMHNLLLQVLEEGALTDGRGQRVSLERNFVLLTSNAGADEIRDATSTVGFHRTPELGDRTLQQITQRALELQFSPEFLGRLDEVILFRELDQDAARCIAQDLLMQLSMRARKRGVRVAFTPAVARWVVERGFSAQYGARELRNVIHREVEPLLAHLLLKGRLATDGLVRARVRDGELLFVVEA